MTSRRLTEDTGRNGLFDGFEAYRTPTDGDYRHVFTDGLIAPDTNVLLNLYRYTGQASADLLAAFGALGERLWVPHQVLVEFWRNRGPVLDDARATGVRAAEELQAHLRRSIGTLRTWSNRVALPEKEFETVSGGLSAAYAAVQDLVRREGVGRLEDEHDTNRDPVVRNLERVLNGHVGDPLGAADHRAAVREGMRRAGEDIPPGYMDKAKAGIGAAGDYLIWEQILREASRRGCDVLFVTADGKEDWWRKERGVNRGPRTELAAELRERGGGRLFMLTPGHFLELAAGLLRVTVHEGSVEDLARVERVRAEEAVGGWSETALRELFHRLEGEGHPEWAMVIRWAAANGGAVGRDTLDELCGGYGDVPLDDVAHPVTRLTGTLKDRSLLPENAVELLTSDQSPGASHPFGVRIHPLVLPLLRGDVVDGDAEGAAPAHR